MKYTFLALSLFLLAGCATLPDNSQRTSSYRIEQSEPSSLATAVNKRGREHPNETGAFPLFSGLDAFVARAGMAQLAEKTLDVQYYLYHNDTVGALLTDQLLKAADRGVRVRLLLDDMDLAGRDFSGAILDAHPNIEIRIFNPFSRKTLRTPQFVTRFGGVTRRMHNKSMTADNQASIIGGRNIGDEYFDASKEYTFSDLDVFLIGPAVNEVSKSFDLYWNDAIVYPFATLVKQTPTPQEVVERRQRFNEKIAQLQNSEYLKALSESDLAQRIREHNLAYYWGDVDIIYDQPEKVVKSRSESSYHLSEKLKPYFTAIENEVLLISPYFVPGKSGVKFLTDMVAQGKKVTVITNSLAANDVPAVHAGYMKYRKNLLRGGVTIYEFKSHLNTADGEQQKYGDLYSGLHAKSFILDNKIVFIGSMNLDPRSSKENTEIGAMIHNKTLAQKFTASLLKSLDIKSYKVELQGNSLRWKTLQDGQEKIFTKEPETTWWQRFTIGVMRIIPAESQL